MTAREEELIAREMLENPDLLGIRLKERRWAEVAAMVRYARRDVPPALAMTDPALYRSLRNAITRFHLRGGGRLDPDKLDALARRESPSQRVDENSSQSTQLTNLG